MHREGASRPDRAGDRDGPAHGFGQLQADSETQARTAEATRIRFVDLGEAGEKAVHVLCRDADP